MKNLIPILATLLLIISCTPKPLENTRRPVEEKPTPAPVVEENIKSNPDCPTFMAAIKGEQAMEAHVIYRDYVRNKNYDEAFEYWKTAYEIAPAADGKRNYHFTDGIKIYEHFYNKERDPAKKKGHMNKIMELYDGLSKCYGDEGYVSGRKAFDYYYKFPGLKSDAEVYSLFKKSIDTDGKKSNYFIINPMTALLVNQFLDKKIPMAEAQKYAAKIKEVIAYGSKEAKTAKEKQPWEVIKSYAPLRLESLEGVKGFYDCEYYVSKYYSDFESNAQDCDVAEETYGRLRWGGCPTSDARLAKIAAVANSAKCKPPVITTTTATGPSCRSMLREGDYTGAISCYETKMDKSSDNQKKSEYAFIISKINYAHLKKYSQARKYARKAAGFRPGWGAPYILIGKLYASSGPLCGPGTGWDSQVVTWPAIDMWNKAKSMDSSVAGDANKLIRKYSKYMPSVEDIFQRNLKKGSSYKVGCWIQESTKIRPATD